MGKWGVGMPATLYLEAFAEIVTDAFGEHPYLVGSALTTTQWRDVDVRVMLDDDVYAAMGFGDPERPQENAKWCAYVLAFTALGRQMTGLPIDFQIQDTTVANKQTPKEGGRNSLGIRRSIMRMCQREHVPTCGVCDAAPVVVREGFCAECERITREEPAR
jgi:hypothetical protein